MRAAIFLFVLLCAVGCGQPAQRVPTVKVDVNEAERKIVYHGELRLAVPDLDPFEDALESHLKKTGGFVAAFNADSAVTGHRRAEWTLRIPAAKFSDSVDAIAKLGTTFHRELSSDDVTDTHIDLEARLKNQKQLEERMLEIVAKKTGELREVVAVETELSRVREEIERLEGQRRLLANRMALSTLVVYAQEQPAPPVALTFGGRIAEALAESLRLVRECAENLLIVVIFLLPWLLVMLAMAAMLWAICRRLLRRSGVPA